MSAPRGPLVLAVSDRGLRSVLTAHLGMAGEMPVATSDHLDPALNEATRTSALLIIEASLIAAPPLDWTETLRDQCWVDQLIIIVDEHPGTVPHDDMVVLVERGQAATAIPPLVQLWQARRSAGIIPAV